VKLGADLPNEDVARADLLATELLHATPLGVGIAAVAAGALTFFMCHGVCCVETTLLLGVFAGCIWEEAERVPTRQVDALPATLFSLNFVLENP
jgi:hypothetical protein